MNPFIEQALLIKDELINYRRIIHENPEVGAVLPKTKAFVMDKLRYSYFFLLFYDYTQNMIICQLYKLLKP